MPPSFIRRATSSRLTLHIFFLSIAKPMFSQSKSKSKLASFLPEATGFTIRQQGT